MSKEAIKKVTKDGKFAILPYMNDKTPFVTRKKKVIGNLVDRYLRNKLSYEEVENIVLNEIDIVTPTEKKQILQEFNNTQKRYPKDNRRNSPKSLR